MLITVAIPCYRSEKNLESVVQEIKEEFVNHPEHDYQIILVCDGSPDHTDEVIRKICASDSKIVGVLLAKNFSQSNARMAALPYVNGDVLVYMDDDGQHPPKDIFTMVNKINEGYDVVYAAFSETAQSRLRKWASDTYGRITEKFNNRPKGIQISAFNAYSKLAIDYLKKYKAPAPSAGSYLYSVTSKVTNIESQQRKRASGQSGYNLKKLLTITFYSLTNYTIMPLRIIDTIGCCTAIIGFIYGLVLIIKKLIVGNTIPGYTSTTVLMLILNGLVLLSLGIVGEYIGRTYLLLSNKPQYVVREEINYKKADQAGKEEIKHEDR